MTSGSRHAVRYSAREFLAVLILVFLAAPFLDTMGRRGVLWSAALTLVLISAGLAMGDRRSTRLWILLGVTPIVVVMWLHHIFPDFVPLRISHVLFWLFSTWVSLRLLRYVLQAKQVDGNVLSAAAATYLTAALAWAIAYVVVADLDPRAFDFVTGPPASHTMKGFNALYFSLVTISTVGYGDIMPTSPLARLMAMAEAVGGILYMALLVARLVAAYSSGNKIEK
jgi:voltage-gated potassium channel